MRVLPFILSAIATMALVMVLNMQLPVAGSKTPRLGYFLSPQHGFWKNAEPTNYNFDAALRFAELKGPASVYFDKRLVPHIYADNEDDAYFIQGYIHAKFRLWQMDFQTYAAGGRLSEILGDSLGGTSYLGIDKFFRRLGMVYGAEASLRAIEADPTTKREADSYTAGVNAFINNMTPGDMPLEYKLLDYKPEPWTNMKTALFLKYMSWDLAGGEDDFEMMNARKIFSISNLEKLYPVIQDSLDPIVPKGTMFAKPGLQVMRPTTADSAYYNDAGAAAGLLKPEKSNGSNNWAVAGSKTQSGAPILCNDPHLGLNLPSIWFEMQISTPKGNCYGATFPGSPAIIIGFNDYTSWGFTNAGRDVKDYYDIQFKDSTMQQYWFAGKWLKASFRNEIIKVKGKPDVVEKIAITVFGPVMYDASYPNKLNDGKCYAVRWKAHDASNELRTFTLLNAARNYNDYKEAISTYQCPGQNMLFATKQGDIAITQQGQFPAKWKRQGDFVMPGNDSSYMWQGFIASNENPMMLNPERGYVSSANQLPVDASYPYYLGGSFPPYRGIIINRKLAAMNNITIEEMQQLQTDNYNVFAEMARPLLLRNVNTSNLDANEQKLLSILTQWNLRNDTSETGPVIFKLFWDQLEKEIYGDDFAQTNLVLKWPDESTLLEALLKDTTYTFIDNINTPLPESLVEVTTNAFIKAMQLIPTVSNGNLKIWGKHKDTGIRHLLRQPALSRLHLMTGGGDHIINATKQYHGPSWRMVVQLSEQTQAYGVYPGGQSGNPGSKFYDSFVDTWAAGKYYTLLMVKKEEAAQNNSLPWKMTFSKL